MKVLLTATLMMFASAAFAGMNSHLCDELRRSDDGNDRAQYRHHCTGRVHKPMSSRARARATAWQCSEWQSGDGNDRAQYRHHCTGRTHKPMSARARARARQVQCNEWRSGDGNDRALYRHHCK